MGIGLSLHIAKLNKMGRINRRGRIDEVVSNIGNSRKLQKRSTIDPQWRLNGKKVVSFAKGDPAKKDYPTYPKSENKTQPVTSPRKTQKVDQGRKALSYRPQTDSLGQPATNRDMEMVKAKGRALMGMWGDKAIGRARSRLARGEQLLPHQSSAWTKHKNDSRGY